MLSAGELNTWRGTASSPSVLSKRPNVSQLQVGSRLRCSSSLTGSVRQELDAVVHLPVEQTSKGLRFPRSQRYYASIVELVESNTKLERGVSVAKKRFGYIFASMRASHFGYLNADEHRNPLEEEDGVRTSSTSGGKLVKKKASKKVEKTKRKKRTSSKLRDGAVPPAVDE